MKRRGVASSWPWPPSRTPQVTKNMYLKDSTLQPLLCITRVRADANKSRAVGDVGALAFHVDEHVEDWYSDIACSPTPIGVGPDSRNGCIVESFFLVA